MARLVSSACRRSGRRRVAVIAVVGSVAGFASVVGAGPAVAATKPTPAEGARRSATRLPFPISGTASLSLDVGTGNAMVTHQLLTLPGVRKDVAVTLAYNSSVFGSSVPSAVIGDRNSNTTTNVASSTPAAGGVTAGQCL